jgi:Tol biopolymer transport system component
MLPGAQTPTVAVVDMNGREISLLRGYDDATWTPDGKLIATGKGFDAGLYEIDPMTQQVTPINVQVAAPYHVAVSPDGRTIAFVTGERVWLIGRDGRNLRQLFQHGASQQRPAFSPDGAKIAFIICNHLGVDATGDVFVTDLHAKEITQLRTNTGGTLVPDTTSRLNWIR